ncbi:MAG: hypothetical protein AB7O59_23160 [Pirellulales bacterium]
MAILTQFVLRLSFGLALGMALTNPRQVTSGYYRNHLYVLLGLTVLATLVAFGARDQFALAPPLAAATVSYVGSVAWLYEKPRAGVVLLWLVAGLTLWGAWADTQFDSAASPAALALAWLDPPTSGLVLGLTMAAMFLGHWYLNSPTMALGPLQRLVVLMAAAIVQRMVVEAGRLTLILSAGTPTTEDCLFLALRWLSGLLGALGLAGMTWQTLKIPNTQSATGILYVAVIVTFLGELIALLMAAQGGY